MNFLKNVCYGYFGTINCNAEFSFIGQCTIGFAALPLITIIHESGHAIAAHLLFKNAKPKIKLESYGYRGGSCSSNEKFLSKTGEWLGNSNAKAICGAAGPIVQMAASLALLQFYPGNGISAISLISNAHYALSAISEKAFLTRKVEDLNHGHDFVNVKIDKGGLAANTLIISSVVLGIFAINSLFQHSFINAYS